MDFSQRRGLDAILGHIKKQFFWARAPPLVRPVENPGTGPLIRLRYAQDISPGQWPVLHRLPTVHMHTNIWEFTVIYSMLIHVWFISKELLGWEMSLNEVG
jgi:hypothetical protein